MTTRRRPGGPEDPENTTFADRARERAAAGAQPPRRPGRSLRAGADAETPPIAIVHHAGEGDLVRRLPTGGRVTTEAGS